MYKNNRILAVIPARGGSKGIPKKNIVELKGKPLIFYTISVAKKSRLIDKLVVSTDDNEIESVSKEFGAEVIKRPKEFAKDSSPTSDVIKHAVKELGQDEFDIVVILEPTSPLRKDDDIDNAIRLFVDHADADTLVSLGEITLEIPYAAKVIKDRYAVSVIPGSEKIYQRQLAPKSYWPYGVIYLGKTERLLEHGTFYQKKTIPFFIERWQNYEVDDIYDLKTIEAIMNYMEEEK